MSSKVLVLIRQLPNHDPVAFAIVTDKEAEEHRIENDIRADEFNADHWMRAQLEDYRKVFLTQFVEFQKASFYINCLDTRL